MNMDDEWKFTGKHTSLEPLFDRTDNRPFDECKNPHPLEFACGFTEEGEYMVDRYRELFEGHLDSLCELAGTSLEEVIKGLIKKIKEKEND